MTKKRFLIAGLLTSVLIADAGGYMKFYRKGMAGKLSVMVVSACSLRMDRLGVYNPESKLSPKIDEWADGSYVFTNAVAELPWQNFAQHSIEVLNKKYLTERGYSGLRHSPEPVVIIPPLRKTEDGEYYWDERDVLNYREDVIRLQKRLRKVGKSDFYLFVHLKYMHYPYYDDVNMNEMDYSRLTPASHELLGRYTTHPERYKDKLPVVELLLNSFDLLKHVLKVKSDVFSAAGVISDTGRTEIWRHTPGFDQDVNLAKELYNLKMQKFDDQASDILNLFNDPLDKEDTAVILMGDHGEAIMEHGVLGHSVNLYDEMLRYPLIVKFPKSAGHSFTGIKRIDGQINHSVMVELVKGIVDGKINAGNFEEEAKKRTLAVAQSRNCQGSMRSARLNGEWKFIKNLDSDKGELYNLKTDPHELHNVIDANAGIAWKLDEYLMEHPSVAPSKFGGRKAGAESIVCQGT
jgi:hypothetical protein